MRGAVSAAIAAIACTVGACSAGAQGQSPIVVNPSGIQALLKNGSTVVSIPIENTLDHGVLGSLSLAWLRPSDAARPSAVDTAVTLPHGESRLEFPLPLPESSIWLRLHWSLTPDRADPRAFPPQEGTLAISQIAGHVFEVKLGQIGQPRYGAPFTVHAQAILPATRAPLDGVEWSAAVVLNGKEFKASRITPAGEGFVKIELQMPPASGDDSDEEATLKVTARKGDFIRDESFQLRFDDRLSAQFQTDKPIYQPGQTIHIRALVSDGDRALEGAKLRLEIDSEQGTVHTARLTSSRFGVVQDDWTLPASADLGSYHLALDEDGSRSIAQHTVRVSRYELPTFNVTVKPDQSAYLPGHNPTVEVHGAYLFGKPVPEGKVKLTRIDAPGKDQTINEGEAEPNGVYTAHVDLTDDFADLQNQNYERFRDLHLAAYYTDPASGRTEQKKFDLRITRQPLHIYVVSGESAGPLPAPFYVSTFYADGRPAQATVDVSVEGTTQRAVVRTNSNGVGKTYLVLNGESSQNINLVAVDAAGQAGTWTERVRPYGSRVRLETDRTIYRTGESVTVRVTSPDPDGVLMLNAVAGEQSVASRVVRLVKGKGQATFPYQPDLRKDVIFIAWEGGSTPERYRPQTARAVVFPDASDLRLSMAADKSSYRPGDQAALRLTVNTADGKPVESAIGLAVVDQAVLERARTDAEFGQRSWFACAFCRADQFIGSVHLQDLYDLKPSTPLTPELDLVAEMLMAGGSAALFIEESDNLRTGQLKAFADLFHDQMIRVKTVLDQRYMQTLDYPRDDASLASTLCKLWADLRDPWGTPYTAKFKIERTQDVMDIFSAGPDQRTGTADDFSIGTIRREYFLPAQRIVQQILSSEEDLPATESEFKDLLAANGLRLETLRDPWDTPYRSRAETFRESRTFTFISAGPDRLFDTDDDVVVMTFRGPYFRRETSAISRALRAEPTPPQTEDEFRRVLVRAGIDLSTLRDAWDQPYQLKTAIRSVYTDRRDHTTVRIYGGTDFDRIDVIPITQTILSFYLHSAGPGGIDNTYQAFDIASFSVVLREESPQPDAKAGGAALGSGSGAIAGAVSDSAGAVVADAKVECLGLPGTIGRETTTDSIGAYRCDGLAAGSYKVVVTVPGFKTYVVGDVPVVDATITPVNATLQIGVETESVTVTAEAASLQTESGELASSASLPLLAVGAIATPRVRDYFPETLLWVPELLTDPQGRARLPLKLADTVTTWKIAAIASTLDGRIAEAETNIRAFQPFFLDFNPPPVLTSGDEIGLPVTIRNYLDRAQNVSLNLQPNSWSKVQGPASQTVKVAANASANATYGIRALNATDSAKQRITAVAARDRDAIERPLRIHPDGQEITQTSGDLLAARLEFSLPVPSAAIAGATQGELRLYPNLLSVLLESAREILESPHGCAEQTVTAGYANLIALRYARALGAQDPKIEKLALAHIAEAVESISGFEGAQGGVSYWRDGAPDVAVTTHALNFLAAASSVVEVDRDQINELVIWLEEQTPDKHLTAHADDPANLLLTGLVARSLAAAQKVGAKVTPSSLAAAYHQLAFATDASAEPYMLAIFVLAALDSGDESILRDAPARLASLAREEQGALYWDVRTNTPFYGWGTAGRLETSAMAVSALAAWRSKHPEQIQLDSVIRRGTVFLLRNRDRLGSWSSTQATVRAMQAVVDASGSLGSFGGKGGSVDVRVNGRLVKTVPFPDDPLASDPILLDITTFLTAPDNRVELVPSPGAGAAVVRATTTHWLPWPSTQPRRSNELRFSVTFDRLAPALAEPVRCSVTTQRVGFHGYGMLLAEIGLPPGAEVDRSSLENLLKYHQLGLDRFDILPDRVVLYLWPDAAGSSFDFFFSTRIPMRAKATTSRLYDYYNPEQITEVEPPVFTVR